MKADLINTIVAQAHGLPDALSGPVSETLVGVCEVNDSTSRKQISPLTSHSDARSHLGGVNTLQALRDGVAAL
jgi:dynactin 1